MKKIFTLCAALSTTLCASAADLTYQVTTGNNSITVTPSDNEQTYFCAPLDTYTMNIWSMYGGTTDNLDMLFLLASNVYDENIFTGSHTFDELPEDEYVLVMAPAHKDGYDIIADGTISFECVTLTAGGENPGEGDDEPALDPLTFQFTYDNESFTIIPSDDKQSYYLWVFWEEDVEELTNQDLTIDYYLEQMAISGYVSEYDIARGTITQTKDDWYIDEDGTYYVGIIGVKPNGDVYKPTTEASVFTWTIGDATSLQQIINNNRASKSLINGQILIGNHNLNGTIVR